MCCSEYFSMLYPGMTLQHTATHCNTLQLTATHCNSLQHTATHCNTLQHIATHCNTLQPTAIRCNSCQVAAAYCNTLRLTATHCNTVSKQVKWQGRTPEVYAIHLFLQHAATHNTLQFSTAITLCRKILISKGAHQ